jgi:hypothetical protein
MMSPSLPEVKRHDGPRFRILTQPHEKQRKSYKSENRYILPNPLTVCTLRNEPELQGTVVVRLVYDTLELGYESVAESILWIL